MGGGQAIEGTDLQICVLVTPLRVVDIKLPLVICSEGVSESSLLVVPNSLVCSVRLKLGSWTRQRWESRKGLGGLMSGLMSGRGQGEEKADE